MLSCFGDSVLSIAGTMIFYFLRERLNENQPLMPDMVLKKAIRPAFQRAGIEEKIIGWHSFRHSLATNLRPLGVDVKVAQELLRHANSRITMDIYTRAVSSEKRVAVPSKRRC